MARAEEACVSENTKAMAAAIVGAVIGGVAGYLFLTENGRTLRRRQIEPALEDLARELSGFSATLQKATGIASEGWKLIGDALGEGDARSQRYGGPHQTAPF
jgi:gas vesicle protein